MAWSGPIFYRPGCDSVTEADALRRGPGGSPHRNPPGSRAGSGGKNGDRMGPTQSAALVMQEQAKAEATRVAALRARGIAADPRLVMDRVQAQQVVDALSRGGAPGLLAGSLRQLTPVSTLATERRTGQMRRGCFELGTISGGSSLLLGWFNHWCAPVGSGVCFERIASWGALGAALWFGGCAGDR